MTRESDRRYWLALCLSSALGLTANATHGQCDPDWLPMGTGLNGPVHALVSFDHGPGSEVYAGGVFDASGTSLIAKWDGSTWRSVGGGMNTGGWVNALTVFDDGVGDALYAGVELTNERTDNRRRS